MLKITMWEDDFMDLFEDELSKFNEDTHQAIYDFFDDVYNDDNGIDIDDVRMILDYDLEEMTQEDLIDYYDIDGVDELNEEDEDYYQKLHNLIVNYLEENTTVIYSQYTDDVRTCLYVFFNF